jgi:hypothetical protein
MADVTSIIGAATGCAALIVSLKSYYRVSAIKALDLRVELGKKLNLLEISLASINDYVDFVRESHMRVLAATGRNGSGEMQLFEQDFAGDRKKLDQLLRSQPKRENNYERFDTSQMEALLLDVHLYQAKLNVIHVKYKNILESDEGRRKEIRSMHER